MLVQSNDEERYDVCLKSVKKDEVRKKGRIRVRSLMAALV